MAPRLPLVVDGIPCDDHDAINAHFDDPGMPEENIDNTIALLESYRRSPLTAEQKAERQAARRMAHEELDAIIAARAKAKAETGWADFEEPYKNHWEPIAKPSEKSSLQCRQHRPTPSPFSATRRNTFSITTRITDSHPPPSAAPLISSKGGRDHGHL